MAALASDAVARAQRRRQQRLVRARVPTVPSRAGAVVSAEVATVEADGKLQLVPTVTAGSRVLGYVVIDSFVRGRSCGGLRMYSPGTSTRRRCADWPAP